MDLAMMNFSWAMDLDPKGANNQIKEAIDAVPHLDSSGETLDSCPSPFPSFSFSPSFVELNSSTSARWVTMSEMDGNQTVLFEFCVYT